MKNRKNTSYDVFVIQIYKIISKVTYRCLLFSFLKMKFTFMINDNFIAEKEALGIRIQVLRQRIINPDTGKPISQEELGYISNVAKKTIGELERGVTNPKLETLLMISKGLNVSIKDLFTIDDI
ncbi:helix-turn-helix domain-containing protein [Flavobacterium taihuense]|nr:helix-turn-helix transcriptional regulator [Flavobacterium taihuense]